MTAENNNIGRTGVDLIKFFTEHKDIDDLPNLMGVLDILSELKISEGYELNAVRCGSSTGSHYQPYCCKAGQKEEYLLDIIQKIKTQDKSMWLPENNIPAGVIPKCMPYAAVGELNPLPLFFSVPFTQEGVFQYWLLSKLTAFMPLFWHANYGRVDYFFTRESLGKFQEYFELLEDGETMLWAPYRNREGRNRKQQGPVAVRRVSLFPKVTMGEDSAMLEYCYWSDWRGLVKVNQRVFKDGDSMMFAESEKKVLVHYDCGIMY